MYEPKYSISDRLLNSLIKLESDKAVMEHTELPTQIRDRLKDQERSLQLFHLAHMLGINITLKDAEKVAEGYQLPIEDARGPILNNFRNVLEFNRSNIANSYIDVDQALIMHLNKIMLNGWKESWEVKFRGAGEVPDTMLDNWVGNINIEGNEDVQTEVRDLIEWFRMDGSRTNPLIRVAVLLYRLREIQPFLTGNKLTLLALADFMLFRYGYTAKTFMPSTACFDVNEKEYMEAWDMCAKNFDLTLWLERFVRSLSKDLTQVKTDTDRLLGEEKERNTKQPFLDLNKRQLKILRYLQSIPTVRREDYCQMMDVSTMTAYRDLNELADKKLIKVEGQGRGTKYMLSTR